MKTTLKYITFEVKNTSIVISFVVYCVKKVREVFMGSRLEKLRDIIDNLIIKKQHKSSRYFISHLYGVADFCALLALKRNLNTELAVTCGMLHDIYQITHGTVEDHAKLGAHVAEEILTDMGLYGKEEIAVITYAISKHSKKRTVHDQPYAELLKDADVLSHCLYDPDYPVIEKEVIRYENLLVELGCKRETGGENIRVV